MQGGQAHHVVQALHDAAGADLEIDQVGLGDELRSGGGGGEVEADEPRLRGRWGGG